MINLKMDYMNISVEVRCGGDGPVNNRLLLSKLEELLDHLHTSYPEIDVHIQRIRPPDTVTMTPF